MTKITSSKIFEKHFTLIKKSVMVFFGKKGVIVIFLNMVFLLSFSLITLNMLQKNIMI